MSRGQEQYGWPHDFVVGTPELLAAEGRRRYNNWRSENEHNQQLLQQVDDEFDQQTYTGAMLLARRIEAYKRWGKDELGRTLPRPRSNPDLPSPRSFALMSRLQEARRPNERNIGAIKSGSRRISNVNANANTDINSPTHIAFRNTCVNGRNDIDTRADTICAGKNMRPIELTGKSCDVSGFHSDLNKMTDVPIATVATAWTDEVSGMTYLLVFHET